LSKFVVLGYAVLFAVKSLGLEKSAFGSSWSWMALAALATALPCGILVERVCAKSVSLVVGYASVFLACLWGLFSHNATELTFIAAMLGFGHTVVEITQKPFFTEFLPKDIIGQLSGAYNICFATGRTLAMAGGGWLIQLYGNNYRLIWIIALLAGAVTIAVASRIPDPRFAARLKRPS
jgi:predicted MFS family arabinose efflux permease